MCVAHCSQELPYGTLQAGIAFAEIGPIVGEQGRAGEILSAERTGPFWRNTLHAVTDPLLAIRPQRFDMGPHPRLRLRIEIGQLTSENDVNASVSNAGKSSGSNRGVLPTAPWPSAAA